MTDEEISYVADLRDTAKVVEATFLHELSASLSSIGIEPLLSYRVVGGLDVLAGARLAFVLTSSFEQTETLTKPEDYGAYLGGSRVWVNTQAAIPEAVTLRATAVGGLRYVLPLGKHKSSFLAPEISYHLPLTNVASGVDWRVAQLRFGLALGWMRQEQPDTPAVPTVPPPPPVRVAPPPYVALSSRGVMPDGRVIEPAVVTIEETKITTMHPMLGHVYFDDGSSTLPLRYVEGIRRAQADTIDLTPMEAAHGELAILAARMKANPSATVRITGNTAGTATDNGLPLAKARAETVRATLARLGVDTTRVTVASRATPALMTRASETEFADYAAAENRRVELTATPPSLVAPVSLGSTDVSIEPPVISLNTTVMASRGLLLSNVLLERGGKVYASAPIAAEGELVHTFDLEANGSVAPGTMPFIARLSAKDSTGAASVVEDTIPVVRQSASKGRVEDLGDVQVERFALILFEFNDVTLRGENAALIEYIRSRLRPGTTVRIIGSTDVIGSDTYNAELSLRRAKEVARLLRLPEAQVEGRGEADPSFPNSLPEGRSLNRTVLIELVHTVR